MDEVDLKVCNLYESMPGYDCETDILFGKDEVDLKVCNMYKSMQGYGCRRTGNWAKTT